MHKFEEMSPHSGLFVRTFEFAPQKARKKGRVKAYFAADLALNFRVLIRIRGISVA